MALRTKTIEYAFEILATQLNAGTRHDFSAITVYIPETVSRRFVSVTVRVDYRENQPTTGTDAGNRTIGIKLGAVAFDDLTVSETIGTTYAPKSFSWIRDVTSYFTSNFGSGTSQTCQVGVVQNTMDVISVCAKLIITYEYDDAAQTTRAKTVRIPIESSTGDLTNTLTELGTNQVPQLTGGGSPFLPEASITIRDIWFEVWGEDGEESGTDFNLGLSLDAESEASMGTWEQGQNYPRPYWVIWRRTDMSPSSAHAFKARTSTTGRCPAPSVLLCVTYEYDHASSGTILNSLTLVMPKLATKLAANSSSTDAYRSTLKFMVQEPGTITLKQSAVRFRYNTWGHDAYTFVARAGGQSFRTYTLGVAFSSQVYLGDTGLMHRVDSGAAQGSGFSLARGENTLTADAYTTTPDSDGASVPWDVDSVFYLNYHSGKHELGADVHAHTVHYCIQASLRTTSATMLHTVSFTPSISEAQVYAVNVGVSALTHAEEETEILAQVETLPGWQPLISQSAHFAENVLQCPWGDATHLFKRHTLDPDTNRLDLLATRRWRVGMAHVTPINSRTTITTSLQMHLTYSAMPIEVERGVTPSSSALDVGVFRSDSRERLYTTRTKTNGSFKFLCHTDALQHFCEAYLNGSSAGRSFDFTPTGFSWNPLWTPSGLSGLGIWLRADLGVTQSGTISAWADQSGNGNNAAQGTSGSRPTYLSTATDNKPAASFDGTDDQLDVTDSGTIGSTTAFSVSCWVRTGSTFPTDGTIIAQWGATERFLMRVETGGNLVVSISNGTAGTATVSAALAVNTWYLLTFTYDGAGSGNSGRLKLFINGRLQSSTFSGTVPASTGNPTTVLSIGSRNSASTYFNGYISEVVFVDNRAMTEDEVLFHYWYRPRFG